MKTMNKQNERSIVFSEYINTISNQNTYTKDQGKSLNYFATKSALLGLRGKLYICDTVFAGVARL